LKMGLSLLACLVQERDRGLRIGHFPDQLLIPLVLERHPRRCARGRPPWRGSSRQSQEHQGSTPVLGLGTTTESGIRALNPCLVSECRAKMASPPNIVPLVLFFVGVALCFWRVPRADRRQVLMCLAAGVLWATLPVCEPSMRTSGYGLAVALFLLIGLTQPPRRRGGSRFPR